MPDIKDLLGTEEEQPTTPLTEGGEAEGNPLEKMDEISKATPDNKKKAGSKKLDDDIVKEMLITGDNSEGMFEPEEEKPEEGEPPVHEDVDEKAEIDIKGEAQPKGEYENDFIEDMLKHPASYKIQTPYGEMTIAEAMRKGYNPITKRFEKEHDVDAIKEKHLSQLNDADRNALSGLMDPASAQVAPADASMYGLDANSPMVRQQSPEGMGIPQSPSGLSPLQQSPAPAGPAMTPEQMAPAEGGMPQQGGDLAALLGGGM